MREGKLREIFDECLTSVFEGRRTVEECLSLYPSVAAELEPLLRTACEVSNTYQAETPSWHAQERIRNRVLIAAQARKRGRTLVSGVNLTPNSWATRHWGGLGMAAAAAVAAVFMVSVMLIGGSSGSDAPGAVSDQPPVTFESVVANFKTDVDEASRLLLQEGRIDPVQIERLASTTDTLGEQYPDFAAFGALTPETQEIARATVTEVIEFLTPLVEDDPAVTPELDALREALGKAVLLGEKWGEPVVITPVPTDAPDPTKTPAPTDTPVETKAPTPSPTKAPPSGTPVPTAPAEATPIPSPDSNPPRALQ